MQVYAYKKHNDIGYKYFPIKKSPVREVKFYDEFYWLLIYFCQPFIYVGNACYSLHMDKMRVFCCNRPLIGIGLIYRELLI